MLSVALRRSTIATQGLSLWADRTGRCWMSALRGASASPASLLDDSGQIKHSCFNALNRKTQGYDAFSLMGKQHFHFSAGRQKKRPRPEPPPRELDLVRYDMKELWKGPKPALYLGFAGLLPFISPTLLMAATETYYPQLAYAQVAYGAAIVSFLGGARWGFALPESSPAKPDWINLANSVVPSLLAWVAMLMSESLFPAATMVIMGLGISLHYDLSLLPTYPSWFKALRTVLTFVAFFSLLGTLFMNGFYPDKFLF